MLVGERDPHQRALMARASELSVEVFPVETDPAADVVEYRYGGVRARVRKGRVFPSLHASAERLCDHKGECKALLARVGAPVPAGIVFRLEQDDALASIRALLKRSGTLVCKPVDGTHGHGVGLGLERPEDVVAHARRFAPRYAEWVAEEQRAGTDLRLQAIGGQLFAACVRVPGGVVGDGVRDIRALATERDAAVRAQNPNNALALDDEARALLRQAGFSETSVPQPGQPVRLRRVANMAQGARALDVGAVLHAGWGELITRLSAALELSVFAVDAMVPDPALAPAQGAVLEVNARPEWLHHTFSEGRTHDVAGALLADALPGLEWREASSRLPRG